MTSVSISTRPGLSSGAVLALAGALSVAFVAMRAAGTLGPPGWRWMLPLGFVIMAALPWLVLTPAGREQIGLKRANAPRMYWGAMAAGAAAAALCFAVGTALYGASPDNWYVSIADNYRKVMPTAGFGLLTLHLIFTIPACIFSPVGEELFFRGFLQRALQTRLSARQSTHAEAALFGLVHLCHHGLAVTAAGVTLRAGSGAIWVMLMFATAWLFAWLRQRSDSLLPAILAHAVFNATMNIFIFSFLWAPSGLPGSLR